ncbi:acyltransferase family protein [uncultured Erythrobacter sp.]|uniref:acyltransferase family protein n=1 Tax=uncultured Erythrobacter sp. TaxID=263913 RepID=UPI0026057B60|nr:acyltransferase family protein [uncultured Erythrobacter sp.]
MKLVHDMMPASAHRPDIEGLRAVAVIAVLLFHLQLSVFGGGYIGVDVFFVISGFLIGGIVVREAGEGRFRFSDYLTRRVKRIVPVMLVVLAAVTIAACTLLLPSELVGYAWSLGFSALFLGNFHFWLHRGAYAESEHEVLLHMWTLGVEGQFYILLPLIVLGLMKLGRSGMWFGLVVLALASAAASLLYPSASFYTLPARLWEFLLGMMVAITPLPFLAARWVREGLALIGLALILYAAVMFDSATPFPGWRAAIPCAGAAAIIAAGSAGSSLVGSVLQFAPVRLIGKISYSLYLWHWPVIVLLLLGLPAGELTWQMQVTAVVLSFGLSVLSWRYIEEPFRGRSFASRPVLLASGGVTAGLVAVALLLTFSNGWPLRFSERGQEIASFIDYPHDEVFRSGTCFIHHRSQSFDPQACLVEEEGKPNVLLMGDSHAAHLAPGMAKAFPGSAISQVTAAGCRPVLEPPSGDYTFCSELIAGAYDMQLKAGTYDLIVLAGRWEEGDLPDLADTLRVLREGGHEVLVVGPAAEWSQFVPRLLALTHERGAGSDLPDRLHMAERAALDDRMAILVASEGADYFSIHNVQCEPKCIYFGANRDPLVVDNSHFTHEASELFAGEIEHPALVRSTN